MTMQVVIQVAGQPDVVIGVTEEAIMRARVSFNPSSLPNVDNIKALTAGLYSVLERVGEGQRGNFEPDATVGREAATAATQIQLGAMMAVSAATAHLVK